jgi:AcrR family transcriptional regulator
MNGSVIVIDIRLKTIFEEASKLFINNGYARAQINHIASACGISVGAIYMLFTGKKAIFDFVLKCVIDNDYIESNFTLPIGEDRFSTLDNEILKLCKNNNLSIEKNLQNDSYRFENMLSDSFDIISHYGISFLIFQKNGTDCGVLYDYYVNFRKLFCNDIAKYVNNFMKKGEIRELEYPEYHARLIIETLSWWGMHVKYDAFETNANISREVSKKVALDALLHAYSV